MQSQICVSALKYYIIRRKLSNVVLSDESKSHAHEGTVGMFPSIKGWAFYWEHERKPVCCHPDTAHPELRMCFEVKFVVMDYQ